MSNARDINLKKYGLDTGYWGQPMTFDDYMKDKVRFLDEAEWLAYHYIMQKHRKTANYSYTGKERRRIADAMLAGEDLGDPIVTPEYVVDEHGHGCKGEGCHEEAEEWLASHDEHGDPITPDPEPTIPAEIGGTPTKNFGLVAIVIAGLIGLLLLVSRR